MFCGSIKNTTFEERVSLVNSKIRRKKLRSAHKYLTRSCNCKKFHNVLAKVEEYKAHNIKFTITDLMTFDGIECALGPCLYQNDKCFRKQISNYNQKK